MNEEVAELPGEPEITGEDVNEDSSPQPEDTSAQPEEKKPKGVQKRIDELTANWREQERINEQLRQQNYELQRSLTTPKQESAPVAQGEPKADAYSTYEEYIGAVAEYKAEQKFQTLQQGQQASQQEAEQQRQQAEFSARASEFAADHPDFNTVAYNPSLPITASMAEALNVSEAGPQLLYHLGSNPLEAARIAQLSPAQAAMEMGRLEVRLTTTQPRTQSNAPDPVQPIQGGGGGNQGVDPETMTADQWRTWRERQLKG